MSNWTFDLTSFNDTWLLMVNIGLLLIFLLLGNLIRRSVPFLRKAFIPSALLGGLLLFLVNLFFDKVVNFPLINARIMQIITFHALAIGFIAMTLKIVDKDKKTPALSVFQNGAITGGTYMLQAVIGLTISLIFFFIAKETYFYDAGIILPLGFGQGPGNALIWDNTFTNMDNNFYGYGSFGLTIASIGFVAASIVGVIYINIFKRKGEIADRNATFVRKVEDFESNNEIEDSESVDKTSIQVALVAVAYAVAFGIMVFFAYLTKWTGVGLFNSVAWGFNFIWGVIAATLIKMLLKFLKKKNVIKRKYVNNYQMDRISGFAFDMMIIAGVASIDIQVVTKYIWLILALTIVGTIVTVVYVRIMTKLCFKSSQHEAFLINYGTLTGTASNGMILLREVDPNYETPVSSIYILSQFPAMMFVAPLLLLLNMGAQSLTKCYITLGIFGGLFIVYTIFLILSSKGILFKKARRVE
ncbi:MAG: hypothetical protein K6E11_01400 [Bacilli bacterium]|nr:hypothetical protein [Bacilli bacterium]